MNAEWNPYDVLGIGQTSNSKIIKDAYRKMAFKYHPDKCGDGEKMQEINRAYSDLCDPVIKAEIDQKLNRTRLNFDFHFQPFTDQFSYPFNCGQTQRERERPNSYTRYVPREYGRRYSPKGPSIYKEVIFTNDEFKYGGLRKIKHSIRVYSEQNQFKVQTKTLTVVILPGTITGHQITFFGEGDRKPGLMPGDIIFVFKRDNS